MAAAQEGGTAYIVSYIEVVPASAGEAKSLLKSFADTARKEDGSLRFEVLQRTTAPHHFAVLEVWKDAKAQETHAAATSTKSVRQKLEAIQAAPYDERPHVALAIANSQPSSAGAVYAVTHVDCIPPRKDDGIAQLKQLSEPTRKEIGNLRFDVLQQASRPNHFTVVEVWQNESGITNHAAAAHTRQFRTALHPMSGALYDERFYRVIE